MSISEIRYKWFMRLVRIITILWVALLVHWISKCSADNHTQVTDNTVNEMTDHYLCINCLVDEDSTWAETIHWHNDTTCLYSMGMFVSCKDTLKCDTVRVKKLSNITNKIKKEFSSYIIQHITPTDIRRVISQIN